MNNIKESACDEKVKPLVTFALFAYNQEKYIREAIEGAFSQRYSPLEIILSDDCSTDSTFDLMSAMLADYKGNHKIILNRNQENLGLAEHINKVMSLANGELIVGAAGDDISLSHRVECISSSWVECKKRCHSIYSSYIEIDESSHQLGKICHPNFFLNRTLDEISASNSYVSGTSHAWSKQIFSTFGDLMPSVVHEDCTLPFRSKLLGDVLLIEEPLVLYRVNVGVSASYVDTKKVEDEILIIDRNIQDYKQKLKDALLFGRLDLIPILEKQVKKAELVVLVGRKEIGIIDAISYCLEHNIGYLYGVKQLIKFNFPGFYYILNYMK